MKKLLLIVASVLPFSFSYAQSVPRPDHLVIILEENRDYTDIVGSPLAPYINSLLTDTNTALFTNAYALFSGSQPNYLMLFSGSNQGVTSSAITPTQFTTCNLGAELISSGRTFAGYAEDLPGVGDLSVTSGNYARKHNPWSNWQGTGTNQLPPSTNLPFTYFPADFDSLPTVAFVVPNLINDMHTPADTSSIRPGDSWFRDKLGAYIAWAKTHNSLLLFGFDESSNSGEHIPVFFTGQGVKGGHYAESVDWYRLLRTIEDMYGLSYCANAATSSSITDCWSGYVSSVSQPTAEGDLLRVWPIPANDVVNVAAAGSTFYRAGLYDGLGRMLKMKDCNSSATSIDVKDLPAGIYYLRLTSGSFTTSRQVIIAR